jgi:tight adherence protein B
MGEFTIRDLWYALTLSTVFVGVLVFLWGCFTFFVDPWRRRRKVAQRLSDSHADYLRRVQILKARYDEQASWIMVLARFLLGKRRIDAFERLLMQADIYRPPATVLQMIALLMLGGFLFGWMLLRSPLMGIVFAFPLGLLPMLYLWQRKRQKTLAVERQMPDAMELLARSLRAGHTLPSAVELLGDELEHPLGTEMKIAYEEQRFGLPMQDALMNLIDRVDSQDLRYFVTAVLIQQESGGNLAEVLENISQVIRGRLNMKAKIRALTAEGRLSALGLTLLPIIAFFLLIIFRYKYQHVLLTHPLGQKILFAAIVLLIIGAVSMKKLINNVEV